MTNLTLKFAFLIIFVCGFQTTARSQTADDFVRDYAVRVNHDYIREQLRYFLDPRIRQKQIFWYNGSLVSSKGKKFNNLQLKFNTAANALYLKFKEDYYRIPSSSVTEFTLMESGHPRAFSKGFRERHVHLISGSYGSEVSPVLALIGAYQAKDGFRIIEVSTFESEANSGQLFMAIQSAGTEEIYNFISYLVKDSSVRHAQLDSEVPEFDGETFLEVKVVGQKATFLKLNSKKSSRSEAVAMIKNTDVNIYAESTYYIANMNKEISQVHFGKKSIKKGLEFAEVDIPQSIPSFRNGRQLTTWMRKVL